MATKYWIGQASAVAQVWSASINAYDAATTYGITIGNVSITLLADTDEQTTIDALVVLLNASTHPYFSTITWARTGAGAGSAVEGTADVAGVEFVFTTSVAGGAGSWNAVSIDTANAGPNVWSSVGNWDSGAKPVANDIIILQDNAVNICWDLDNAATTAWLDFYKYRSHTGKIGLNRAAFALSANGETVNSSYVEYRETYLQVNCPTANGLIHLEIHNEPATRAGSSRLLIDTLAIASTVIVYGTASAASETGKAPIRLKGTAGANKLIVHSAPAGFGYGVDIPNETGNLQTVDVTDPTNNTKVHTGINTSIATWTQDGGQNIIEKAGGALVVNLYGGTLRVEGEDLLATATVQNATLYANNAPAAGNAITTATINSGGKLGGRQSARTRTWATVNLNQGGRLDRDDGVVTITTLNIDRGAIVLEA